MIESRPAARHKVPLVLNLWRPLLTTSVPLACIRSRFTDDLYRPCSSVWCHTARGTLRHYLAHYVTTWHRVEDDADVPTTEQDLEDKASIAHAHARPHAPSHARPHARAYARLLVDFGRRSSSSGTRRGLSGNTASRARTHSFSSSTPRFTCTCARVHTHVRGSCTPCMVLQVPSVYTKTEPPVVPVVAPLPVTLAPGTSLGVLLTGW